MTKNNTDRIYPESFNGRWENFTDSELRCKHTGLLNPHKEFITLMDLVQTLRTDLGFPMGVSSAYRHESHPIEAAKIAKGNPAGEHALAAIDLEVDRYNAFLVLKRALELGFTGIGVNQKGEGRFLHLDLRENPTIWSY